MSAYVAHKINGNIVSKSDPAAIGAVRRTIEARAALDGVSFEQAEREVLGVVFNERSFGRRSDFQALERLARCLYEQRKVNLLGDLATPLAKTALHRRAGNGDGDAPTVVNVVGGSVAGTGTWVRVIGRFGDDAYEIEADLPLESPLPAGVIRLPGGLLVVEAHKLVTVTLARSGSADAVRTQATSGGPGLRTASS